MADPFVRFGTAPHRVSPGVWATRTGRRLTPAGSAYWEGRFRAGRTDGRGHVSAGIGAAAGVQTTPRLSHDQILAQAWAQQHHPTSLLRDVKSTVAPIYNVPNALVHGHLPSLADTANLAMFFPFGMKGGLRGSIEKEVPKTPEQQVLGTVKAGKRAATAQKKLHSAERTKRASQLGPAFEQAGGGMAGHVAKKASLKGPLPTLQFDKLTHLTGEQMDHLANAVEAMPHLQVYEKLGLTEALSRLHAGMPPRNFEVKLIEKAFGAEAADQAASLSLGRKIMHGASEVINTPRSILASFDVSAPFRQGIVSAAHNPKMFFKDMGPMFKALVSEHKYQEILDEIKSRPSYEAMHRSGVKFTELGPLNRREEQFMSNLAEKITGGKYSFVRASSRAYTGFLDRMRADLFDSLANDLGDAAAEQGVAKGVLEHDIARFVNWATGRGELGPLERAAVPLNTVLFSPRLFASRIQTLNPVFYAQLDPLVRKKALASTLKLIAAGSTLLGLSALGGAKVNLDPTNADFGKIRFGNTRFDIWGGHQQIVRLLAQLEQGKITSSTTGKTLRLGGGFGKTSRRDIVQRFLEGKLAPTPSLINDWFKGTDFADKPFSWKRAIVSRSYPLLIQDTLDIQHQTHNPWLALGGYGVGAFGIGLQTYAPKKPTGIIPAVLPTGQTGDPFGRFSTKQPKINTPTGDPFARFGAKK